MQKDITITISGQSNSGKSSLHYKIRELLKTNGIDVYSEHGVDFVDSEMFDEHYSKLDNNQGIFNILKLNGKDSIRVKIKEEQTRRV